jgi:hypothetical protein
MFKEVELIGAIAIYRRQVRVFTDKQIQLAASFASQTVIAIENARLLDELRESLQQQTATVEILRAIAQSPSDIMPFLAAVTESPARLCEACDAAIVLKDGDDLAVRAHYGPIPIDFGKWPISRKWTAGPLLSIANRFMCTISASRVMNFRMARRWRCALATALSFPCLSCEKAM